MRRDHWKVRNNGLDPEVEFPEIVRNLVTHEFPWDTIQALSFALFRTYAVPGIGRLLEGVEQTYRHGRHPEARTAKPTANRPMNSGFAWRAKCQ